MRLFLIKIFLRFFRELKAWKKLYFFRRPLMMTLTLLTFLTLIANRAGWLDRNAADHISHWNGQYVELTGIVKRMPDIRMKGVAIELVAETIAIDRKTKSASGVAQVEILRADSQLVAPGDRLRLRGRLNTPTAARIPGTFNAAQWLSRKDVYSVLYTGPAYVENLGNSRKYKLLRLGWVSHRAILQLYEPRLGADPALVLAGLTIGQRPRKNPEIRQIFTETGAMHVLVASGSNVALVVGFVFLLLRLIFRAPRMTCLLASLPFIWLYALVVGLDAPIMRAAVMTTLMIIYYALNRNDSALYMWSLSALVILLGQPKTLFDIGFLMSFITVFGLLHWFTALEKTAKNRPGWVQWTWRVLLASLTAQIWLLPITINIFQKISPLAPLFNVVIMPMSALGLIAGLGLLLVWPVEFLLTPSAWMVDHFLKIFIWLVRWMAAHSPGPYWASPMPAVSIVGFYAMCFCLTYWKKSLVAKTVTLLGIVFFVGGWAGAHWYKSHIKTPTITWVDTGRSISMIIQQPKQPTLLIAPASADDMERNLLPYCAAKHIRISTTTVIEKNEHGVFHVGDSVFVVGHPLSLQHQKKLVNSDLKKIDILQTRFSPKTKWHVDFVERFSPAILVDTGHGTEKFPIQSPWPEAEVIIPQRHGVWVHQP
jgi:ComEC/Rec2-related protein